MGLLDKCSNCGFPLHFKKFKSQVCACRHCVGLRLHLKKINTELDELYNGGTVITQEITEQEGMTVIGIGKNN